MHASATTLEELDPWERVNRMPDNRPLKASEAAILMTFSLSTLERMRVKGTGPDYFQGGIRKLGSTPAPEGGVNQHVRYFKADIQAWWSRGKVSSTMQAAKLKGQVFATIFDLAEQQPFYIDPAHGGIAGLVEQTPIDTVIERLGAWDIVWMPATEAASRGWTSLSDHRAFAEAVGKVLSSIRSGIDSALEATDIGESTGAGSKSSPAKRA